MASELVGVEPGMILRRVDQLRPCSGMSWTCCDWMVSVRTPESRSSTGRWALTSGDFGGANGDFQRDLSERHLLERVDGDVVDLVRLEILPRDGGGVGAGRYGGQCDQADFVAVGVSCGAGRHFDQPQRGAAQPAARFVDDGGGDRAEAALGECQS